jgi:hypothetical protein
MATTSILIFDEMGQLPKFIGCDLNAQYFGKNVKYFE